MLASQRVPAIAVLDAQGALRGVITRTDVLRALDCDTACARDAMSSFVFAMPARTAIEKAAALMAYEGVGQIVVTGFSGELLGMVSTFDITRHVAVTSGYLPE